MGQFDSQYERRERERESKLREKKKNNKIRSIRFKFVLVKIRYKAFFILSFVTYDAWLGMVTFYNSANDFRNGSFFPLRVENTPIPRILLYKFIMLFVNVRAPLRDEFYNVVFPIKTISREIV